jgi:hypothetical protein
MLSGDLAREGSVADQAFAHVPTQDLEHLADSIGMNGCSDGVLL